MFTFLSWDSLGELASELGMVLLLCIFLFIWAARLRNQEERRRAALPPPPAEAPPARPGDSVVAVALPLVDVDRAGRDPESDPQS